MAHLLGQHRSWRGCSKSNPEKAPAHRSRMSGTSGLPSPRGGVPPAGIHDMGTSPSCLTLNSAGTRLYSANETDRVGEHKEGTASAFAINRADGKLELLNTVGSGGAGPT